MQSVHVSTSCRPHADADGAVSPPLCGGRKINQLFRVPWVGTSEHLVNKVNFYKMITSEGLEAKKENSIAKHKAKLNRKKMKNMRLKPTARYR